MRLRILPAIAVLGLLSVGISAFAFSEPSQNALVETTTESRSANGGQGRLAHNRSKASSPARRPVRRDLGPGPFGAMLQAKLREQRVVVVLFHSSESMLDRLATLEARAGAEAAGAAFVAVDVSRSREGLALATRHDVRDAPALLILRRATLKTLTVVGYADRETVAQAAENARRWRY